MIGFVSCVELGGHTLDDELIVAALADLDIRTVPVFWDEDGTSTELDAVVLRSPWNYHLRPDAFLDWVDRAARSTIVFNDPKILRWNAHKGYLFDLECAGIPIAPTVLCTKWEACDLRAVMEGHEWNRVVIKPAISASSFMTAIVGQPSAGEGGNVRYRSLEDGQQLLDSILETRDALVQPFLPAIFERGERCLTFIDGQFSHAIRKAPFTDIGGGGESVVAEQCEIQLGLRALALVAEVPLYARVDLLRADDGGDLLMELELIDPELYMRFDSKAPRRFAAALVRRVPALKERR